MGSADWGLPPTWYDLVMYERLKRVAMALGLIAPISAFSDDNPGGEVSLQARDLAERVDRLLTTTPDAVEEQTIQSALSELESAGTRLLGVGASAEETHPIIAAVVTADLMALNEARASRTAGLLLAWFEVFGTDARWDRAWTGLIGWSEGQGSREQTLRWAGHCEVHCAEDAVKANARTARLGRGLDALAAEPNRAVIPDERRGAPLVRVGLRWAVPTARQESDGSLSERSPVGGDLQFSYSRSAAWCVQGSVGTERWNTSGGRSIQSRVDLGWCPTLISGRWGPADAGVRLLLGGGLVRTREAVEGQADPVRWGPSIAGALEVPITARPFEFGPSLWVETQRAASVHRGPAFGIVFRWVGGEMKESSPQSTR